jgi:hypothetical protein
MATETAAITVRPCDQHAGSDRSGSKSPADTAMASLTRASILDHPVLDDAIVCGWRGGRSLDGHRNVLL